MAPVKRKKNNALGLNMWLTESYINFNLVVISAIFPTNPNTKIDHCNSGKSL